MGAGPQSGRVREEEDTVTQAGTGERASFGGRQSVTEADASSKLFYTVACPLDNVEALSGIIQGGDSRFALKRPKERKKKSK